MAVGAATLVLALGAALAYGLLFVMGANDVANSIGAAVGSGALNPAASVMLAAVFEFAGAALAGGNVAGSVAHSVAPRLSEESDTLSGKQQHGLSSLNIRPLERLCAAQTADLSSRSCLNAIPRIFRCAARRWPHSVAAVSYLTVLLTVVALVAFGTAFAIPLATTHAVIGAIVGVAVFTHGLGSVSWEVVSSISVAWVLSPMMGGGISLIVRYVLRFASRSHTRYKIVLPALSSLTLCSLFNVIVFLGPHVLLPMPTAYWHVALLETCMFCGLYVATLGFMRRNAGASVSNRVVYNLTEDDDEFEETGHDVDQQKRIPDEVEEAVVIDIPVLACDGDDAEDENEESWSRSFVMDEQAPIFRLLLAVTAAAVAYAHGSNDVSNGVGPFLGILRYYDSARLGSDLSGESESVSSAHKTIILVVGASAIVAGLVFWGHGVIATVGTGISRTKITYARAFAAQFATAAAVLTATALGIPISTSHCVVASVAVSSVAYIPATERALGGGVDVPLLWRIAGFALATPFIAAALSAVLRIALRTTIA